MSPNELKVSHTSQIASLNSIALSLLTLEDKHDEVQDINIGGHNQRMQKGSAIHHGEMNCLENAGRLPAEV